jgi:hypothetical protein
MADRPQIPVESKDHRALINVINTIARWTNKPVMPVYTVAELALLPQSQVAEMAFASDGCKISESTGSGTGVAVYYDGVDWRAVDSGAAVFA